MRQRNNSFGVCNLRKYCTLTATSITGFKKASVQLVMIFALTTPAIYSETANVFAETTPDLAKPTIVVPEKISGVTTVTAEQVIQILTSDDPPLLIDARIKDDRDFGYIESSVSLPDIETNCGTLNKVSKDKNKPLMFYCNGVQCGRSVVSIKIARSCGYHKLSWFKGGFAEWEAKGYQYIKNR